jgi:peptidoglycan/xylan/chitin deacetylase (PgdA/CDA1 family)
VIPVGTGSLAAGSGALSITFDDFPRSAWDVGGEILAAHRVRGTYYISGRLEGTDYRKLPHFRAADVRSIAEAGHEIGCHTFDHISTLKSSAQAIRTSILENEKYLAEILPSYRMRTFAYPFGDVALRAKRHLNARFAASRGVRPGLNGERTELTNLRAFALEERQIGRFDWRDAIETAAKTRAWMIIFTHDVSANPSPYGCKPDDLESIVQLAKGSGLQIAPVGEILNERRQAATHGKLVEEEKVERSDEQHVELF